jgi:hypothetical protein
MGAPTLAATVAIGKPLAGLDLGAMSGRALGAVATFIARLGEVSAGAAAAGLAVGFGVLFIPSTGPRGRWVKVGGPGKISYFQSPDVPGLAFRYTTPDGVQRTWDAAPGPGGNYRDPDGRAIARWVKTGAKAGLVVSTAALLGQEAGEPQLCPAQVPDNGGKRGQEYEAFVKARFNSGNPTPTGLAYSFVDPRTGIVKIDDCQHQTGAAAEYKGPGYAEHMLKEDPVWVGMLSGIDTQAARQVRATVNRPLIWFVDEKPLVRFLRARFFEKDYNILVVYLPMPRDAR